MKILKRVSISYINQYCNSDRDRDVLRGTLARISPDGPGLAGILCFGNRWLEKVKE